MPSSKRMRHHLPLQDNGLEGDDDGQASASLLRREQHGQQHKNKRPRISNDAPDDYESAASASEREGARQDRPARQNTPPMTQHQSYRDGAYEHLNHESEDDDYATQALLARTDRLGDNVAADNGIILEVTMINFMCNVHTKIVLGPLINFIIGENGSGKSTILTAITLCLGGKTSATNRGSSLKSYIKQGEEQCRLIIMIKNEGIDAYQPDIFGCTITVERNFSQTGSSGFKLKSETGRIISNKKSDVDELTEYFQMQVDNPMNILTQDLARIFLSQATASQKYKFFIKGVQLEQLDNDYQILAENIDNMAAKLEGSAEVLRALKRMAAEAKERFNKVEKRRGIMEKIHLLRSQCVWSQVVDEEHNLAQRESMLSAQQTKRVAAMEHVELKSGEYEQYAAKVESSEKQVNRAKNDLVPYKDDEAAQKQKADDIKAELASAHIEQRNIKQLMEDSQRKVAKAHKDIAAEQQRLADATGGAHADRVNRLVKAQEKAQESKRALEARQQAMPELEATRDAAQQRVNGCVAPIQAKRAEISTCEARVKELSQSANAHLSGFSQQTRNLIEAIKTDQSFNERPIGPMGAYIKLLKPQWSPVLEKVFGSALDSFIVTNNSDREHLSRLMKSKNAIAPIIIGNNHPLDTRGNEPDEQYDTILRMLDIENEMVRRQLVINQAIEQSLLIADGEDAARIMYQGPKPAKVQVCYSFHPTQRGWGVRRGYMSGSNNANQTPVQPTNQKPRMKTDQESQLKYQQESLHVLKTELGKLEAEQGQLKQAYQRVLQAISKQSREYQNIKVAKQQAEEDVDRLQEEVDGDNAGDNGRLAGLQESLKDAEEDLAHYQLSYMDCTTNKNNKGIESSNAQHVLKESMAERAAHEHKISTMDGKLERIRKAASLALQAKQDALDITTKLDEEIAILRAKADKQRVRVADFVMKASEVIPVRVHIPEGKTHAQVERELEAVTKQREAFLKQQGGTDEEIKLAWDNAERVYENAESQDQSLKELLERMGRAYKRRIVMWRNFQRHISARARMNFTYLLSERGFRGKIIFDHKHKLLDLKVEPDETVKSAKGRQTKTLSGGEKSFSSICLLLSLWEAMGAPLRCLDEFDVFMDQVNRDVSTNMIIVAARRSVGRQYILITPNALGGDATSAKDVKIIRLVDPRQRRIPDLMQSDNVDGV